MMIRVYEDTLPLSLNLLTIPIFVSLSHVSHSSQDNLILFLVPNRSPVHRKHKEFIAVFSFAPEFQCYYLCESLCLFYLSLNSDFHVSKIMHL